MSIFYVLIGLLLLVVGGEFLVRSSVGLSFKLKLSKMVIGLTVVSFATSAPELLVSLQAAYNGLSDIALGNVIGSNIATIDLNGTVSNGFSSNWTVLGAGTVTTPGALNTVYTMSPVDTTNGYIDIVFL